MSVICNNRWMFLGTKDIPSLYFSCSIIHQKNKGVLSLETARRTCLQCFCWFSRWLCEGVTNLAKALFRGPFGDFPWETVANGQDMPLTRAGHVLFALVVER